MKNDKNRQEPLVMDVLSPCIYIYIYRQEPLVNRTCLLVHRSSASNLKATSATCCWAEKQGGVGLNLPGN